MSIEIIEEVAGMPITFDDYPHDNDFMVKLRERINKEIEKVI